MHFTDTHTHLYASEFDSDRDEAIARALAAGVSALYLPAIDSAHHDRMLETAARHPGICFPMMGLHPTSVKENYREELAIVEQYLADPAFSFFAVGEIGIDLYWDKTYESAQLSAFSWTWPPGTIFRW